MANVIVGRVAAKSDSGMRVNHFFAFRQWIPTVRAMGTMLNTLRAHLEKGFLGGRTFFGDRGVALIQYWRSFEDQERLTRSPNEPHLRAWQRFNKVIGFKDGSVGCWHESYLMQPGHYEVVYGNMPIFGLAAATNHVPAIGSLEAARRRLGGENEQTVLATMP